MPKKSVTQLHRKIPPRWDKIAEIEELLAQKFSCENREQMESIIMVSRELLENAIKYQSVRNLGQKVRYSLELSTDVRIEVENHLPRGESLDDFKLILDKIQKYNGQSESLYMERLAEILDKHQSGVSRLGLLRIVYEGGFKLDYSHDKMTLKVIATKEKLKGSSMRAFQNDELRIDISQGDDHTIIQWSGRSRGLNPEKLLDPYLEELAGWGVKQSFLMDLSTLTNINSSTIPPIMNFMNLCEQNQTPLTVVYSDQDSWQRAVFRPLALVVKQKKYRNVKVMQLSEMKEVFK